MNASPIARYKELRARYPAAFADGAPPKLRTEDAGGGFGVMEEHAEWLWVREWDGTEASERPVYLSARLKKMIEGYFDLMHARPDLFTPSETIPICADRRAMLRFIEQTGRDVGLVFDNGKYYQVVCDLIDGDPRYAYGRVLYPYRVGNGTVIIPRLVRPGEPPRFGILHVYRHSIRAMSGGEFPRGFQEPGITPEQNAVKELREEFGIGEDLLERVVFLGESRADTGLTSGQVQIYLADVREAPEANLGHEGIKKSEWISEDELLDRLARGELLDGMTHAAVMFYLLNEKRNPEAL